MSNTNCLVRIEDNLLHGEPSPNLINPNTDIYMEVVAPLADVGLYETRNYRWNVKESKFYDVGLKDQGGAVASEVVLKPFAMTDDYFYRGTGFSFDALPSTTSTHNILIASERAIDGSEIWIGSRVFGCNANFKIVDIDGLYATAGTVLRQFAFDWNINPDTSNREMPGYPATIPAGLYIQIDVLNPSANTISVYGNLRLHAHKDHL